MTLTAAQIEKEARELVRSDPDGTYSYNCPNHGLDSGCHCKESGYERVLERARGKVAIRLLDQREKGE